MILCIYLRIISTKLATEWKLCGVSTYFLNLEVLCSNTFTQPPWSLAQGWRFQVAKNTFLWVKLTYRNLLKYLGMLRKRCKSSEVLLMTQTNFLCSLPFCRLMYKYKACLHWIQSSYHCSNALRPHSVNHIIKSLNNTWIFRILTHSILCCVPYNFCKDNSLSWKLSNYKLHRDAKCLWN